MFSFMRGWSRYWELCSITILASNCLEKAIMPKTRNIRKIIVGLINLGFENRVSKQRINLRNGWLNESGINKRRLFTQLYLKFNKCECNDQNSFFSAVSVMYKKFEEIFKVFPLNRRGRAKHTNILNFNHNT